MNQIKKRKPIHPGIVLEEHYLKELNLNLQDIADHLGIARNTLFKLRTGRASVTPAIAIAFASAFDTSPQMWLNLQQKYDLWIEEFEKPHIEVVSFYKVGCFTTSKPVLRKRQRVGRLSKAN